MVYKQFSKCDIGLHWQEQRATTAVLLLLSWRNILISLVNLVRVENVYSSYICAIS